MTVVQYGSRASWGAQNRNGVGTRKIGRLEKYLHHTVTAHLSPNASVAQERAQMRTIERIGQQRFGAGISYNIIIFPSGRAYIGADVHRISYHSGAGRNTRGIGLCLAGNYQANPITDRVINAIAAVLQDGVRRGWWGDPALTSMHRNFSATSCPGQHAANAFNRINQLGRGGKVTPPSGGSSGGSGSSRTHTVVRGDTVSALAKRYGTTVKAITDANKLRDANKISVGQRLAIPASGGSTPSPKPQPKPKARVWPDANVPVTDRHSTSSHNAWVKLLSDVGYKNSNLTINFQRWLRDLGYYKGRIDGKFGSMTVRALQSLLVRRKLLPSKAYIDGKRGKVTIRAEISYLNSQRKFYN